MTIYISLIHSLCTNSYGYVYWLVCWEDLLTSIFLSCLNERCHLSSHVSWLVISSQRLNDSCFMNTWNLVKKDMLHNCICKRSVNVLAWWPFWCILKLQMNFVRSTVAYSFLNKDMSCNTINFWWDVGYKPN